MIDVIQAKITVSSLKEKIKLLSLAPESWSIEKNNKKFHVTEYVVKKAKALKKNMVSWQNQNLNLAELCQKIILIV